MALGVAVSGAVAALGPHVGNLPGYHTFVDERSWLGVPHAGDVLSNLALLVAGFVGAGSLWRLPPRRLANMERAMAALIFAGLIATAACSATRRRAARGRPQRLFEMTHHVVSGHTIKHLVAALAAWPVIAALHPRRSVQNGGRDQAWRAALGVGE